MPHSDGMKTMQFKWILNSQITWFCYRAPWPWASRAKCFHSIISVAHSWVYVGSGLLTFCTLQSYYFWAIPSWKHSWNCVLWNRFREVPNGFLKCVSGRGHLYNVFLIDDTKIDDGAPFLCHQHTMALTPSHGTKKFAARGFHNCGLLISKILLEEDYF